MTTQSWSSTMAHATDADFRAWGSDFSTHLATVGMVQTADTGQINWTTVTRPGTNTVGGYEIWRFNDTLQSTAPIYLKISYGTGSSATFPLVTVQVGTGSNGSGTLTGAALTAVTNTMHGATPTAGTLPRYFSAGAGYCCAMFHVSSSTAAIGFLICRTCDATGAPTDLGCVVYWCPSATASSTNGAVQALRFTATAAAYTAATVVNAVLIPHAITTSLTGTDLQAFVHWFPTPRIAPAFAVCSHVTSEISLGSTFTATLVGTTARTYISIGNSIGSGGSSSGSYALAMLWE
jgi:hypothetical protein